MFKKLTILLLAICTLMALNAQNNTNSPYTRYGYGEVNENTSGAQRAMGRVSTAFRSNKVINPAQPASYSAVDSTTFMFDLGVSGMVSTFKDFKGRSTTGNANLEYLTIQLPIGRYFGLSAGIMPYSFVGYDFEQVEDTMTIPTEPGEDPLQTVPTKFYTGTGGISQVYAGLSGEIARHLSLGVNIYYMWGKIENARTVSFSDLNLNSMQMNSMLRISDFRLRYGAQVYHTFKQAHTVTLGFAYENKKKLHGKYEQTEITTYDTVTTTSGKFELPAYYSAGINYNWDKRLNISFDYTMREWSKAYYYGQTDSLRNTQRYSLGISYQNDPRSKKYVDRVEWRMGGYMSNSYLKQDDSYNFGMSFGVGLPLRNSGSMINATVEYNHRGNKRYLKEDTFKFTINANFCENWFFKRKL